MEDSAVGGYYWWSGATSPLLRTLRLLGLPGLSTQSPAAVGRAGERIVVGALQRAGFWSNWDTRAPGSTDIEAWSFFTRHLLIQVKTAVYPYVPPYVSDIEARNIRARARRIGAEALEARVQVGAMLIQVGDIAWRRLWP